MRLSKPSSVRIRLLSTAIAAVVLCAAWLSGCDSDNANPFVPTLRPLYTATDLDMDAGLPGTWSDEKESFSLVFEPDEKQRCYKLTVTESDNGKTTRGQFTVHLVQFGSGRVLDFYPEEQQNIDWFLNLHFTPTHSFARMDRNGDRMKVALLSGDWLKDRLVDKSVDTPHELVDGWLLLTGTTQDLRNLVHQYVDDANAFSNEVNFARVQPKKTE